MATQVTLNSGSVDSAGSLLLRTNGTTTAVTVDTSQNVGVGVTPSSWATVVPAMQIGTGGAFVAAQGSASTVRIGANAYYNGGWKYTTTAAASVYQQLDGSHIWTAAASGTAGNAITFTQAMTLDASGNWLLGQTTTGAQNLNGCYFAPSGGMQLVVNHASGTSSGNGYSVFCYNASVIGSITQNGTTAVAYNTSSDYRLKNTIAPMTGALAKVALLKPCTYKWNADNSDGEGFIAHELAEVCPHAVTGEKDAVDKNGNPKYQGIDTSFLVATLTAAIQEQQALITQLQADVAALKGA